MTTKIIDIDQPISLEDLLAHLKDHTNLLLMQGGVPVAKVTALADFCRIDDLKSRILGLHEGQFWMADDFDAELPDEFWLGSDQ